MTLSCLVCRDDACTRTRGGNSDTRQITSTRDGARARAAPERGGAGDGGLLVKPPAPHGAPGDHATGARAQRAQRCVSRERERDTHRQLSRAGGASLFRPLCLSLAASLARPPTLACALTVTHLLARALTVCCAGTCKYPGAEVQFVGYQYSGASGPLPGTPYSTLADDEGNVRASLPLPPPPPPADPLLATRSGRFAWSRKMAASSSRPVPAH